MIFGAKIQFIPFLFHDETFWDFEYFLHFWRENSNYENSRFTLKMRLFDIFLNTVPFPIKKKIVSSDSNVYFQFYFYILAVSSALLCVYILCNLYNLVWIICPQMGTMYRIICRYQEHTMDLNDPQSNNVTSNSNNSALHPNLIRFKSCQNSDDEVTIPLAGESLNF